MKPTITIYALLIAAATIFGCKKSPSQQPAAQTPLMTARVDTSAFSTIYCETYFSRNSDTFYINGYNLADTLPQVRAYPQVLLCIFNWNITKGTFVINDSTGNTAYYITGPTSSVKAVYGEIMIAHVPSSNLDSNQSVAGTFHFTCTDSTFVSNGSFLCGPWYGLF